MNATITSKGQVTIPAAIRERLGLKQGDQLEFTEERGVTVLRKARPGGSPFRKQLGILPPLPGGLNSVEFVRGLRGRDEFDLEDVA